MKHPAVVAACLSAFLVLPSLGAEMPRPRSGPVEILKVDQVKAGMMATAWTVFNGSEPEAVPVEILGVMKNVWGPRQHIILGKMGGKAARTSVAAGMSGSPVYYDGKLLGAVSLRIGAFSPDAICGITPIELMLEINELDQTRPADAKIPGRVASAQQFPVDPGLVKQAAASALYLTPIANPLTFSGFSEAVLRDFAPLFDQLGMVAVQGGATVAASARPVANTAGALQPGDAVSGILVAGDMSVAASGTVTYNDGKRVLAFGHPLFNIGPLAMPMAKADVVHVLASSFTPTKILNATDVVGALRQDRHSGILGELGEVAPTIPVSVRVRSFADGNAVRAEKSFRYEVFQNQKWTPQLMVFTLYNSLFGLNDFAEESTFRLRGDIELEGPQPKINLSTMQTAGETPVPAPMLLAGWFGDKFNRLFTNPVKMPQLKSVDVTIDLLPERRVAVLENAWLEKTEVYGGEELAGKVFLHPYRGARLEKDFRIKVPAGIPRGALRVLVSDADTLNRRKAAPGGGRLLDVPETVSLLNQELGNNQLYISLLQPAVTAYYDDKTLPNVPASVLNVLRAGREPGRRLALAADSPIEQVSIPFDLVISGSQTLNVTVK